MLNKVLLTGRLVADPETVTAKTGTQLSKMRIAVDRRGKEKETDFFDLVAFGKTSEFASAYLEKGRMIALVGQLRVRSYEANDGTKRNAWEIVVDEIHPLDSRKTETTNDFGMKASYTSTKHKASDKDSLDGIEDPFAE